MGAAFKLRNGSLLITTEAPGGIYNSEQLKKIASLADEDSAIVKVTEDQRLALFVGEDKIEAIVSELKDIGLGVRHYQDGLHQPTTCIGELCPDYQQDALGSALKITEEMTRLSVDNPLKIGINGCAQCCVPCHTLDISIVGDEQGYRISMGGKNSQIPEMATFMAEGVPEDRLPTLIHNIVQLYKDSAEEGETLQDVMDRVGISKFADVLAPYSQDAAGGEGLFGEEDTFSNQDPQESEAECGDELEVEDHSSEESKDLAAADLAAEDFSDLEEVDDFDQGGLDEQAGQEAEALEEVGDQFIDEEVDSDFVDNDELGFEEDFDKTDVIAEDSDLSLAEDDDFSDVDDQDLDMDLDAEERLTAAESENAQKLKEELQQLDSIDDEDDLEFSDFEDVETESLEIGDEELDQSSKEGLKVIDPVTDIDSKLEGDVVIGTSDHEASDHDSEVDMDLEENIPDEQEDLDLSEISDEELSDFEEELDDDNDMEVSTVDRGDPPNLEEDLLETSELENNDSLLFDASDEELEEMDSVEADEAERRINEDIRDSQLIHEPDSNEKDRNAILRKVEENDGEQQVNEKSPSQVRGLGLSKRSQFQFEGFDINENGDYILTFTSGAQFQFNYDLIKDGPRKIKLGAQSIYIGLDASMIFIELEGGLRMNLPLNAA